MKIVFTNTLNYEIEKPQPASKYLPEWYKNMPSYYQNNSNIIDPRGQGSATIKKCMPVFDAITAGYILTTPADVYVDKNHQYFWPTANMIEMHLPWQAETHPFDKNVPIPKFMNPWMIKTPKGYSCLFIQPMHRESVFTIFPGIVDTDSYVNTVNFPFVLNDISFTGFIPKGTPMAQVIPFKRDNWESELGTEKDALQGINHRNQIHSTFYEYYKKFFHKKKSYK